MDVVFADLALRFLGFLYSTGLWAIVFAFIIFVIAGFMGIYVESYLLRSLGLLVLAGATYLMMPLAETSIDRQYFQSFIIEFVGAFVVLMLFESWLTDDRGMFIPMALLSFGVSSVFLLGMPFMERELSIEFAVMILGAFLTTILLKREWWWANADPTHRYTDDIESTFAKEEFAEKLKSAPIHMKVVGRSEDEVEYKLGLLRHTMDIAGQSGITENRRRQFIVYIAGNVRDDVHAPLGLSEGFVEMRIFGDVVLVQQAVNHLPHLFNVDKVTQRHSAKRGEVEASVRCSLPEMTLSDTMFEHFRELVLQWRVASQKAAQQAASSRDPRQKAFYEGVSRSSQQYAQQLMEKLDAI